MVAVGIMAVIMTVAIPNLYRAMQQNSMRKAVSDVMEACNVARSKAILDNTTVELRIRPGDRSLSVSAAAGPSHGAAGAMDPGGFGPGGSLPDRVDYQWGDRMVDHSGPASGSSSFSAKLGDSIIIEGLGVNGEDWTEDAEARVRFRPNGTCDEMSIVLCSDKGERRNIWLEAVTGLAEVEVDIFKFRDR
jgi:type II secretory pathway pseudopilin PulG